jgi:hypothetical protein
VIQNQAPISSQGHINASQCQCVSHTAKPIFTRPVNLCVGDQTRTPVPPAKEVPGRRERSWLMDVARSPTTISCRISEYISRPKQILTFDCIISSIRSMACHTCSSLLKNQRHKAQYPGKMHHAPATSYAGRLSPETKAKTQSLAYHLCPGSKAQTHVAYYLCSDICVQQ